MCLSPMFRLVVALMHAETSVIFLVFEAPTHQEDLVNDQNSRVAVITGAGGGLGVHIAHRFAADGYTTVLVGRTESTLRQAIESGPEGG